VIPVYVSCAISVETMSPEYMLPALPIWALHIPLNFLVEIPFSNLMFRKTFHN